MSSDDVGGSGRDEPRDEPIEPVPGQFELSFDEPLAKAQEEPSADDPPIPDEPVIVDEPPVVDEPLAADHPAIVDDSPVVDEPLAADQLPLEPPSDPAPAPQRDASRQSIRSFAPVVAAALCIPCIVLLTLFLVRLHSRDATDSARTAAARAARTAAPQLLGYDYRHIGADVAGAKKLLTKPFSSQYEQPAATLLTEAPRLQAIVRADVRTVSVEDASRNRVTVLVFVDQSSVKKLPGQAQPVTRVDEQRVRLTMVRSNGRWLISEVASV